MVFVGDQYRIFGLHDNQIFQADSRYQAAIRMHIGVTGTLIEYVALEDIALFVLITYIP
ncbi:hypothetical protein D3C76_1711030 [compost metagenome]